jgi:hypothetical protein
MATVRFMNRIRLLLRPLAASPNAIAHQGDKQWPGIHSSIEIATAPERQRRQEFDMQEFDINVPRLG